MKRINQPQQRFIKARWKRIRDPRLAHYLTLPLPSISAPQTFSDQNPKQEKTKQQQHQQKRKRCLSRFIPPKSQLHQHQEKLNRQ